MPRLATGHPPRRRPPKRRAMRVAGALSLAVLTLAGLANVALHGLGGEVGRVDPFTGLGNRPSEGLGLNFLLVGNDRRDTVSADQRQRYHLGGEPCHCTDTIMLAHISRDRSRLTVVSIPRDTYTTLPPRDRPSDDPRRGGHPQKLNAAYSEGGPALTVRTVERLTGIHLDHYLELDFASFMKIVDVLGGVQVCTPYPLRDPMSGLELPAGTSVLDGGRALEYVRARHLDGSADIGRMQRQQRFVAEIVHRATRGGVLFNPVKLAQAVRATLGAVSADSSLGTGDLITLAAGMRNLSSHSAEFATVPLSDLNFAVPPVGSTVKWDEAQAARLFDAIRNDRPITQPRQVTAVAGQTVAPAGRPEQRPRPRPSAIFAPGPKGKPAVSAAADVPPVTGDQVLCR